MLSGSGGSQKNCAAERRLDDAAAIIAARLSARGLREAACRRRRSRHEPRWLESALFDLLLMQCESCPFETRIAAFDPESCVKKDARR